MGWREFIGAPPRSRKPVVQTLPMKTPGRGAVRAFFGGLFSRTMAWVVGGIFGVVGVVTAIRDAIHHHHGLAPWLIAVSLLFLLVAVVDMWRKERERVETATDEVEKLERSNERLEEDLRKSEHREKELHVELAKAQNYVLRVQAGTTPDNTIATGDSPATE